MSSRSIPSRSLTTHNVLYRLDSPSSSATAQAFNSEVHPGLQPPSYQEAHAGNETNGPSFDSASTSIPLLQSPTPMATMLTDPPAMWRDPVSGVQPQLPYQEYGFTYVELDGRAYVVADNIIGTTRERRPTTSYPFASSFCQCTTSLG